MKTIGIIGGGVAGLAAGIYAQQAGYKSEIYEKHSIVGGLCTGWDRHGYHIDGCIHWLTGTKNDTKLYKIWKNVGALSKDINISYLDSMGTYVYKEGTITLWRDLDKLANELTQLSPEDTDLIQAFIHDIKVFAKMEMPVEKPINMMSIREKIKFIISMKPYLKTMNSSSKITVVDYGKQFQHPAIQKMFAHCMPFGYSFSALLFTLANFASGNAGIPEDGSLALAKRMENKYISLGGVIHKNTGVAKITIDDKKAIGIEFEDYTKVEKDYLISTCDPKILFNELLDAKYHDKEFDLRYNNEKDYPINTSVICSFALKTNTKHLDSAIVHECTPYLCGEQLVDTLNIKLYNYENHFAPEGYTLLESPIMLLSCEYEYCKTLSKNKVLYNEEKKKLALSIQERLVEKFPQWHEKIELLDVATPVTFNRYTGAYKGGWRGYVLTPPSKQFNHSGVIKGIENLYVAGQWTQSSGGLPVALLSGKFAIQKISKNK